MWADFRVGGMRWNANAGFGVGAMGFWREEETQTVPQENCVAPTVLEFEWKCTQPLRAGLTCAAPLALGLDMKRDPSLRSG